VRGGLSVTESRGEGESARRKKAREAEAEGVLQCQQLDVARAAEVGRQPLPAPRHARERYAAVRRGSEAADKSAHAAPHQTRRRCRSAKTQSAAAADTAVVPQCSDRRESEKGCTAGRSSSKAEVREGRAMPSVAARHARCRRLVDAAECARSSMSPALPKARFAFCCRPSLTA